MKKVETNAIVSMVETFTADEKPWSIAELARWGGIGGIGPVFVGSPTTVADILQEWSRRPGSTASTSPMRSRPRPSRIRSTCWCRNCSVAVSIRRRTGPDPARETVRTRRLLAESHPAHGYRDIEAVKAREAAGLAAAE